MIVCLLMAVLIYLTFPEQAEPIYHNEDPMEIPIIEVIVNGEVNMPDTYYFFGETTIYEAINMAGGLTDVADDSTIAYGQVINQHTTLTIHSKTEEQTASIVQINVNEASFAQLLDIPYMSESRAAYIIMYREEHGDFQTLDDLIHVKYIGAATLEQIKPYLKLS